MAESPQAAVRRLRVRRSGPHVELAGGAVWSLDAWVEYHIRRLESGERALRRWWAEDSWARWDWNRPRRGDLGLSVGRLEERE